MIFNIFHAVIKSLFNRVCFTKLYF